MQIKLFFLLLSLLCASVGVNAEKADGSEKVKVACVGNSITAGYGVKNRDKDSYPMLLGQMLGKEYDVRNFGVSSKTMLRKGNSYMAERAYQRALDFCPDILIVKLGTNDSNPEYWQYKKDFKKDMRDMLKAFRKRSPEVKIYLCYPVGIQGERLKDREQTIVEEIIPMIDDVAERMRTEVIDLHTPTKGRAELFSDELHPNEEGALLMAKTIYKVLTGKDAVYELQPFPGLISEWKGYKRYDFSFKNRQAIVVCPDEALEGNPWIWRPAFFGAFAYADEALLEKGFHVVYYDMAHQYGCPKAVEAGTVFYDAMVASYGLSPKVTLEGFSRGGYYALQWAVANPGKVACLYLDNPVCDIFSWPGKQRTEQWNDFLDLWGLDESITPECFEGNPIRHLEPLARAGVPILAVCGDSDRTVPFNENMKPLRDAYAELGGPVELILKPGADHHPHSLTEPEPIVDFIVRNQPAYCAEQHWLARGSLQNSLLRFEKDRKGRVVFLGGSITNMNGWRDMVQAWLKRRFPYTDFEFVNAGIPSTGTTPHAFRLENDVLSKGETDLLFVEGAVNDYGNGFSATEQVRGMEGVVRHMRQENPYTDIVMLHFISDPFLTMFPKGQTPDVILNHERVANYYGTPSVNCAKEVSDRIEAGEFTWADFGGLHPNKFGHKFYAASLESLLNEMWQSASGETGRVKHDIPEVPLDEYSYVHGKFVPLEMARLGNGWAIVPDWKPEGNARARAGFVHVPMLCSDKPGSTFRYSFRGKSVGLFMACGPASGILEYSIDGGKFQKMDTYTRWSKNLYLPWLYVLASELDADKTHTLVVRVSKDKNMDSKGTEFVIRNIVVDRAE